MFAWVVLCYLTAKGSVVRAGDLVADDFNLHLLQRLRPAASPPAMPTPPLSRGRSQQQAVASAASRLLVGSLLFLSLTTPASAAAGTLKPRSACAYVALKDDIVLSMPVHVEPGAVLSGFVVVSATTEDAADGAYVTHLLRPE